MNFQKTQLDLENECIYKTLAIVRRTSPKFTFVGPSAEPLLAQKEGKKRRRDAGGQHQPFTSGPTRKELLRDDKKPFKLGLNSTFVAVFIVYCHLPLLCSAAFMSLHFLSSAAPIQDAARSLAGVTGGEAFS